MNTLAKAKVRFPLLTTLLLASIFVCGSATGMFVYATGSQVIEDVYMKMVSHTEYRYGESGQIIARLVDFQGNAVTVTSCNATILYPNKSFFANSQGMIASGNITGDHYYQFIAPNGPEGVYEYQATCYYLQGATPKNSSVTNSFHLSGAFNSIIDNQTAQNAQLTAIQGNLTVISSNLTAISSQISAVNSSLSGQFNSNITSVLTQIGLVNSSITGQLNSNISSLSTQMNANTTTLINQINANVTQILAAFNTINISVNFTPVLTAISNLDAAMAANFTALSAQLNNNFTATFNYINAVNTTANNINSVLLNVNTTTTNTYQYLTGTLTTNVNSVLSQLGVINATVNRIETNTVAINSTVSTILNNQENQVFMTVFSG